jgi:hypothetical protein
VLTVSLPSPTMHVGDDLVLDVITSNPTHHVVYAAEGGRGGLSVEPTLGWLIERIHPEDRVRVQQTIESAIHQKTGFDIEYRLLTRGGIGKVSACCSSSTRECVRRVGICGRSYRPHRTQAG